MSHHGSVAGLSAEAKVRVPLAQISEGDGEGTCTICDSRSQSARDGAIGVKQLHTHKGIGSQGRTIVHGAGEGRAREVRAIGASSPISAVGTVRPIGTISAVGSIGTSSSIRTSSSIDTVGASSTIDTRLSQTTKQQREHARDKEDVSHR